MEFDALIAKHSARLEELERELGDGALFSDPKRAREVTQEHAREKAIIEAWDELTNTRSQLADNRELAQGEDTEMAELASAEIPELEQRISTQERNLQVLLLPPEPGEDRDAIVEIRGGAGGDEAALFAADLYKMYSRYAELNGLSVELLETSPSDLGGFKEVIFRVSGEAVFRKLRFESGVHRVQRVPATETQGRVHTSTATVAVMPEAEEVDIEIKPDDIRVEVCRAGGPGGQGVNTTDSAVQILHLPTGRIVRIQDGRSQQKNKEKAMMVLRSRLLEDKIREEQEKYSAQRKDQIGTGERNEKIRTYNFKENRLTDHRIGLTLYSLDRMMLGELDELLGALVTHDLEQRLAQAQLA